MQPVPSLSTLNGLTPLFRGVTLLRQDLQPITSAAADPTDPDRQPPPCVIDLVPGTRVVLRQDGVGILSGARGG